MVGFMICDEILSLQQASFWSSLWWSVFIIFIEKELSYIHKIRNVHTKLYMIQQFLRKQIHINCGNLKTHQYAEHQYDNISNTTVNRLPLSLLPYLLTIYPVLYLWCHQITACDFTFEVHSSWCKTHNMIFLIYNLFSFGQQKRMELEAEQLKDRSTEFWGMPYLPDVTKFVDVLSIIF
jgi:hypothetical protein